jgi:SPP1 gp7 family putative phage head morphogenesis protein
MQHATAEIKHLIASSTTPEEANQKLEAWTTSTGIFGPIGDVIFVTTAMADMAGQLMVAGREAEIVALAAGDPTPPLPTFLDLPWEDAINAFRKRGLVSESDFQTLLRGYAQRSAVARELMLKQIQAEMTRHLDDAIANGEQLPQFAEKVDTLTQSLGLAPAQPHYVEMVFRTNVQGAYGAGRYKAMRNPVVMRARPFVQYRTVGDARVREEHRALDGKTYRADDPVWQRIAPPNGFNCRCSMITLSRQEAEGLEISDDIPEDYEPTPGFDKAPMPELDIADVEEPEVA